MILSIISELEILAFEKEDAKIAAYIWSKLKAKGAMINDADLLISAICIRNKQKIDQRLLFVADDFADRGIFQTPWRRCKEEV